MYLRKTHPGRSNYPSCVGIVVEMKNMKNMKSSYGQNEGVKKKNWQEKGLVSKILFAFIYNKDSWIKEEDYQP